LVALSWRSVLQLQVVVLDNATRNASLGHETGPGW
jgi:hypothetical protein